MPALATRGQYCGHAADGKGRRQTSGWEGAVGLREGRRMKALGRGGQFLGLALPALAVLLELGHAISLGQMLVMLVAALCCFWIGRIVEGYGHG